MMYNAQMIDRWIVAWISMDGLMMQRCRLISGDKYFNE